jgi:serine/threonine-protein kinase
MSIHKGDILAGRFRVERLLGTGGMGIVVAAFHLQLEQLVALKFLLPEAAKDPEIVERFAREARAAARIESEHVARVLDVGELDAAPYIVMEYLDGENLEQLLARTGPLSIVETANYMLEACDALAQAHGLGIVHRDLKPSNVFLAKRADGRHVVKLLDFGLVKFLQDPSCPSQASITRTSALMGSPAYMAPEQLRCPREVDARADIWSLGAILYESLCGAGPFSRGTMPEVCAAILTEAPTPPRSLRAELPAGLEAVVLRCLQKELDARYQSVAELATDLLLFAPPGAELSIERIVRVLRTADAKSRRGRDRRGTTVAGVQGHATIDPTGPSSSETRADPFAATKLEANVAPIAEPIEIDSHPTADTPQLDRPQWFSTAVLFAASALFAVGASIFAWTVVTSEGAGAADRAAVSDEDPTSAPPSMRGEPAPPAAAVVAATVAAPSVRASGSSSAPATSGAPEPMPTTIATHPGGRDAAVRGSVDGTSAPATTTSTSSATPRASPSVDTIGSAGAPLPDASTSSAAEGAPPGTQH